MKKDLDGRVIPTINGFKSYNGGPGSGNFGHLGRPGKVGGSSSVDAGTRARSKGIVDRVRETGGFTVSSKGEFLDIGKSTGFSVGGYGTEGSISVKDWNNSTKRQRFLRKYIKENAEALASDPKHNHLGGWVSNGKVYLDVSKVFKSKKEAVREAMKTDQDAIFDFKTGDDPNTQDLVKEYGLEKEAKKYRGIRAAERKA